MRYKSISYWFTLVETTVAVVVIWILFSALIPKINESQARSRDLKRKVDVQQIWNALIVYKENIWTYPIKHGTTIQLFDRWGEYPLVPNYLTSLPSDIVKVDEIGGVYTYSWAVWWDYQKVTWGAYEYITFPEREGKWSELHFILSSKVENTMNGNWMWWDSLYWWALTNWPYEYMWFWTWAWWITAWWWNMFALTSVSSLIKNLCKSYVFDNPAIPYIEWSSDNTTEYNWFWLSASWGNVCHLRQDERQIIKRLYIY